MYGVRYDCTHMQTLRAAAEWGGSAGPVLNRTTTAAINAIAAIAAKK